MGTQTLSDANGNGTRTGWTGVYNGNSRVGLAQPSGDWALKISTVSSMAAAAGVNKVNPYWVANSTAGTTYTATAQVMPSVSGEKVYILLREITAGGSVVGSIPSSTATLTDTGSMTTLASVSYRSVNSGDQIRYSVIVTNLSGSQVLYLDNPRPDVAVRVKPEPLARTPLPDPAEAAGAPAWSHCGQVTAWTVLQLRSAHGPQVQPRHRSRAFTQPIAAASR